MEGFSFSPKALLSQSSKLFITCLFTKYSFLTAYRAYCSTDFGFFVKFMFDKRWNEGTYPCYFKLMQMKILGLVLAVLLANCATVFAEGIPDIMMIKNDKVAAGEKVEFQIFGEGEVAMAWPKDYLVELEMYLGEYPNGIWGVHKVFSIQDLSVGANNMFGFNAPSELNRYRLTMKNGVGDRFAEGVFEVLDFLPNLRFGGGLCSDLSGHWGKSLIEGLLAKGKYPLDDKGLCRPDSEIARERLMSWLMIVLYPGASTSGLENPYSDLDSDFGSYVLLATKEGIVNGQGGCATLKTAGCKFGTGATVNRAEILKMVILARGIEVDLADLKAKFPEKDPATMFSDGVKETDWFYPYLYFATANAVIEGIAVGDGKVKAAMNEGLTFAQAAKIINLLSIYGS